MLAEHDHPDLWVSISQAQGSANAFVGVAWWQADVGHDYLGPISFYSGQQAFEVHTAAGQLDTRVGVQNAADSLADQVAVLGQNDPEPRGHGGVRMARGSGLDRPCPHPSNGVPALLPDDLGADLK